MTSSASNKENPLSDVASKVVDDLVEKLGKPRDCISLSDRLAQDLGLDGDDADEFFHRLQERFGTDFTKLHQSWNQHFYPEGLSATFLFGVLVVALIGGLIAEAVGLVGGWGLAITIPMLGAFLYLLRKLNPDRRKPITVGEVVDAVARGSWA